MSNWISITIDTLYESKVAALIDACDSAALATDQDNRAAALIQGVIDEVRGAISSNQGNLVDEDETTIPKSLRNLAVDMIIPALKGAIEEELTPAEEKSLEYRREQLSDLASGKLKVEQPDTAVEPEVQSGPAAQLLRPTDTSNPFKGLGGI